ncbi:MAG: calcineurin-like phosphoesterase family protein [Fimbriimonadales bacterium]|nr:calcineurin-like phosphoesterase family protein [Fimbriimonadales bacterium]
MWSRATAVAWLAALAVTAGAQTATGRVFVDSNRNGLFDPGEAVLPGVRVSNGVEIVLTDRRGIWELPYDSDTIFFLIKPRGYMTAVDEYQLPKFYYIHKPAGSPAFRYPGVAPTGSLPASIDFPLYRRPEPDRFRALFFGDTQPRNLREIEYLAHDIVEPLIGKTDAMFGVTLGDIVFDDLSLFRPLNQVIALIGIPWYNVIGNHDINFDAKDDKQSTETFQSVYGPPYYSFDHGPTHFVVLDNIMWTGANEETGERGRYRGGLGKVQLEWLKRNLALVPEHQLVVLLMHIPLTDVEEKQEIYDLISKRPYCISVSAHTHFQEHRFITDRDGFKRPEPHHHIINVTTCGSWWQGAPDEFGVPHTTMRDGAPNGYSIFTFDGNQYSIEFRAARADASWQMNIISPPSISLAEVGDTWIYVNVFGGSEKSKVEMRVGSNGVWTAMTKTLEPDPSFQKMVERDRSLTAPFRPLPGAINSPHLWKLKLPGGLSKGTHPIHVRTTDMFGQTYLATRAIRIED